MGKVTIYDIATAAGTSVSTVSRVLNGSGLIAPATSRSVLEAAERLGYTQRRVRRPAARSVLNIVVFLPLAREPHAHLFYDAAELFAGIQTGFGTVRAHTIVALNGSTSPFEGKKLGDIDGCIFAFSDPPDDIAELLLERAIPTVVINRRDDRFASVVNDYEAGMRALVAHVAARRPGARVAYVSTRSAEPVASYRRDALLASSAAHGDADGSRLSVTQNDCVEFESASSIGIDDVEQLLDRGYRTLVCANDLVALAVHERLLRMGLRAPDHVGLTGYDASPVRGLISAAITTVDLAVERLGEQAAAELVDAILSRTVPTGRTMIPGELIVGTTV